MPASPIMRSDCINVSANRSVKMNWVLEGMLVIVVSEVPSLFLIVLKSNFESDWALSAAWIFSKDRDLDLVMMKLVFFWVFSVMHKSTIVVRLV